MLKGMYRGMTDGESIWAQRRARFAATINRIFPERQFVLRTAGKVDYFRLRTRTQVAAAGLSVVVLSWGLFATTNFFLHGHVVAGKDTQIANARLAYHSLINEVAEYQRKFSTLTADLEENHTLMLSLVEKNATLQRSLSSVSRQLEVTEAERQEVIDTQERMRRQVGELTDKIQGMSSHNFHLEDNLSTIEDKLASTRAERNELQVDVARLSRLNDDLESRLGELQASKGEALERLTDRVGDQIGALEQVVTTAGLSLDKIVGPSSISAQVSDAQGGPYIPLPKDAAVGEDFKATLHSLDDHLDRLEVLRDTVERMPLAAPMRTYYITSSFGKRRDPLTKRWSAHYGIDLGGPMRSKIYSTAAGTVTFAGWKGRYGRLIELDHGDGIKTRYGHLNKILVKKGETVKFHQNIGLLGNSGRSTGPHLHYEVLYENKPINPMKFIKAGRYVFKDQ